MQRTCQWASTGSLLRRGPSPGRVCACGRACPHAHAGSKRLTGRPGSASYVGCLGESVPPEKQDLLPELLGAATAPGVLDAADEDGAGSDSWRRGGVGRRRRARPGVACRVGASAGANRDAGRVVPDPPRHSCRSCPGASKGLVLHSISLALAVRRRETFGASTSRAIMTSVDLTIATASSPRRSFRSCSASLVMTAVRI